MIFLILYCILIGNRRKCFCICLLVIDVIVIGDKGYSNNFVDVNLLEYMKMFLVLYLID